MKKGFLFSALLAVPMLLQVPTPTSATELARTEAQAVSPEVIYLTDTIKVGYSNFISCDYATVSQAGTYVTITQMTGMVRVTGNAPGTATVYAYKGGSLMGVYTYKVVY